MELQPQKAQILRAVQRLPEDASIEDAIEELYLLYKINRGIQQLDAGEGIPHDEARERLKKWLE